jgi:phage replication O-like protein O
MIRAGFTKIENRILERILTSDLTKRQLKILLLIVRFSFGCQKNYAVLKNKDFSYAKVSPYCIKAELHKLVEKRVIKWNPEKEMVWINLNSEEWLVDNSINNSLDNSERFVKIATKNLPKQQPRGYQNSNPGFNKIATSTSEKPSPDKGKQTPKENIKENIKKKKENVFLNIFENYFLKISPLTEKESLILKDILKSHNPETIEKAISIASSGNERSFSFFLKVLDDLARRNARQSLQITGLESLKSILNRSQTINPKL